MKKLLLLMLLTVVVPVGAFDFNIATKICENIKSTSLIFVAARNVGKAWAEELNENGSQDVRDSLYCLIANDLDKLSKIMESMEPRKDPYDPYCDPILELLNKRIFEGFIDCVKVQDSSRGWEFLANGHHCEIFDIVESQLRGSGCLKIKPSLKELGKAFAQECNSLLSHSECSQLIEELESRVKKTDTKLLENEFYILTVEECIACLKKVVDPHQLKNIATKVCKNIKPTSPIVVAATDLGKAFGEELNRIALPHDRGLWKSLGKKLMDAPEGMSMFSKEEVEILGEMGIKVGMGAVTFFNDALNAQVIDPDLMLNPELEMMFYMTFDQAKDAPGVIAAMKKLGNAVAQECNNACSVKECEQLKEFIIQENDRAILSGKNPCCFPAEYVIARALIPACEECIAYLK